jgi:hypothetical protein
LSNEVAVANVDEYRARAAAYDRKATTMGYDNAAVRAYYQALARHWRSLALLAEDKMDREQCASSDAPRSGGPTG